MRTWKHHSTRAKLRNCILPAFRNLECVPPPRMKLFGNQQLECLQAHMCFSRQKHTYIYILDPPSHHKKGSLPHNFHSFSIFSGYLEALGIWMYLFENITLFFVHYAGLGTFTRFPHSITLTKVSFPCKNCDFGHIPEVGRLLGKRTHPATNGVEQTVRMWL